MSSEQLPPKDDSEDTEAKLALALRRLQALENLMEAAQTRFQLQALHVETVQTELAQTRGQLASAQNELDALTGTVAAFAMPQAPEGWLVCDGRSVKRETYARLFKKIGVTFGEGDGKTTFHLPDLRGVFVRGWDNAGRCENSERQFGSFQSDQIQSHTHTDNGHEHDGNIARAGGHLHTAEASLSGKHGHIGTTQDAGKHIHDTYVVIPESGITIIPNIENIPKFVDNKLKAPPSPHYTVVESGTGGSHRHQFTTTSANSHTHNIHIDTAESHAHSFIPKKSYANLGEPKVSHSSGKVRHGLETRPKNIALLFCIKY